MINKQIFKEMTTPFFQSYSPSLVVNLVLDFKYSSNIVGYIIK